MKRMAALLLALTMVLSLAACGGSGEESEKSAYANSLEVMETIWNGVPEESRFMCFGGNQNGNSVDNAPGNFDLTDTNGLSGFLLIPDAYHGNLENAASLTHMLNANTFTSAAIRVSGAEVETVAGAIEEKVQGNHFICGAPERLVIMTTGDYIVYVFGASDLIDTFQASAQQNVEGISVFCDDMLV